MHAYWGGLSWQRTEELRDRYWVQEQTGILDYGRSAVTSVFLCCICVHSTVVLPVSYLSMNVLKHRDSAFPDVIKIKN